MAFVLFIWPSLPKATENIENRENYSFGPQTQAKCQVSSMVKQGQPSPVVSLPFRLYWQLSDPTVWITIISHSPHWVPPVSQTYSQTKKLNLCTEILDHKSMHKHKNQISRRTPHKRFPLLHSFARLNSTPPPFIWTIFSQLMSDVKWTLRGRMPWKERIHSSERDLKAWRVRWKTKLPSVGEHGALMVTHFHRGSVTILSPLLWFLANGALHENISVWLHYLLARLRSWFWVTQITSTHDPHIQLQGGLKPAVQASLCGGEPARLSGWESHTEP